MGEAKQKREELRKALLIEADKWMFPPSAEEAAIVAELAARSPVMVRREEADRLAWMRMKPRECHANVSWYVENDPTRATRHVLGWWKQGDQYVLHSVIGQGPHMMCITPQLTDVPEVFPFLPDNKITWKEEGEPSVRRFYRDGWPIPVGVRTDPLFTIGVSERMKQRLLTGMKPWDAMRLADQEHRVRLGL